MTITLAAPLLGLHWASAADSARRPETVALNVAPLSATVAPPGLWNRLTSFARPDVLPSFPPQPGQAIRVAGKPYRLDARLGGGNTALVQAAVAGDGTLVAVKVLAPEFRGDPLNEDEPGALKALAATDIPHAALLGQSADGGVLVKEYVPGPRLSDVEALDQIQLSALMELARRLIRIGYTADLTENNLKWDGVQWKLVDAGGFKPAPEQAVTSQLKKRLGPEFGRQK